MVMNIDGAFRLLAVGDRDRLYATTSFNILNRTDGIVETKGLAGLSGTSLIATVMGGSIQRIEAGEIENET